MEGPYGSEWPTEKKMKCREMVAPEARYIFVHSFPDSGTNEMTKSLANGKTSNTITGDRATIVGFVQYRFTIEEDLPVLYVYELQLEPHLQGKGLGRFLMQLIELIACKVLNSFTSSSLSSCLGDYTDMEANVRTVLSKNYLA